MNNQNQGHIFLSESTVLRVRGYLSVHDICLRKQVELKIIMMMLMMMMMMMIMMITKMFRT